jgi:putative ABC transport system permease protein
VSPGSMPRPTTMNFSEAVAISASSLWAHKLRSILTLIGVVICVAAVIAVVSLINGANQYVATRVFRLGADVFGLSKQPSIITNVDDWLAFQKRKRITYDDYEAVRELCKSCKEIGASLGGRVEVKSGLNSLKDTNLRAWTPQMAQLYDARGPLLILDGHGADPLRFDRHRLRRLPRLEGRPPRSRRSPSLRIAVKPCASGRCRGLRA